MKVWMVKRLGGLAFTRPFCNVWLGVTRKDAVDQAVKCMMGWWKQYAADEELDGIMPNEGIIELYAAEHEEDETIIITEVEVHGAQPQVEIHA